MVISCSCVDFDHPVQASIAKRLATLHSLHQLRVHLELPESNVVQLPSQLSRHFGIRHYTPSDTKALCETAATLASVLPQSGLALWLLQREDFGARWRLSHQVIKDDINEGPQTELDPHGDQVSTALLPYSLC